MTRDNYLENVPVSMRGAVTKAWDGSKAMAVKAKCLQCKDFKRAEIGRCTDELCALHAVRPFQPKAA